MARIDPQIQDHLEWLGFVQPTGLVVSAPALVRAGAILDRRDLEGQRLLQGCVEERPTGPGGETQPEIVDFQRFAREVLGWSFSAKGYAGVEGAPIPAELELTLPDYGVTLRPDLAVREPEPTDGAPPWQLLVRLLDPGADFDKPPGGRDRLEASEHGRMERLLRERAVPAGLLFNGRALRLISAPPGESSGWLEFKVADMVQTAGRPICAALRLLLGQETLLARPRSERFAALLKSSREFQNEVSEKLAEQVLHALYELLRGFQAAHDASGGELLRAPLSEHPDEVYRALLTVILRLVFLLYAEEREMLPAEATFVRYYSLGGLYERLREDDARNTDAMNQRYGAWAQLLALFRMVHDGANAGEMTMPARHGVLFDPDRYPFLEGRRSAGARQIHERIEPPLVPDGTIHRVLEKLLVLDGERISYRALDVEQIGSVYETMMGFRLERASGRSLAIKANKPFGAPTTVNLEALLAVAPDRRAKWLSDNAERKLTARVAAAVKDATTLEELHAALAPISDPAATPDLVPAGAMVLQPSPERRRSGSHYTPRSLTEPIVRTTLEPVLRRLRAQSGALTAEQILDLRVCDPAMGSGAFLVEACRQLADELVAAWAAHGGRPEIPADEDEVTHARRLVAQRCLYGVDRNPVAVDLAKMSLWLVTLAREHPLTFLDQALRHGDSLVGLTRRQIETFDWKAGAPSFAAIRIGRHIERVGELRGQIREAAEDTSDWALRDMWDEAQRELDQVRLFGDLAVAAFFAGAKAKERDSRRLELAEAIINGKAGEHRQWLLELRHAERPVAPFHWQIEFPEVFDRDNPGFDAIVGNPPFAGKNTLGEGNAEHYADWLKQEHPHSHGNADLVAHFFRRGFNLLREGGALGLIATNTIGQGDTRASGLRWICTHGGEIYAARKRVKWPGRSAAVVVSVVHIFKGQFDGQRLLDGRSVPVITAYLFHAGGHQDPARLAANAGKSFQGSIVLGMGFTFDDTDKKGVATPIAEMERLIAENPANAEVIFPYIGGQEVNDSPTYAHHRYVINFGERSEEECRTRWPELMAIVEERVKPERAALPPKNAWNRDVATRWWQFGADRRGLQAAIADLDRVLVICRHQPQWGAAFLSADAVFAESLVVFAFDTYAAFCALQSRPHEIWARFFGSTLEDRLRYTPSDCFETFPFPPKWESDSSLEAAGQAYYDFRAALMVRNDEGLTKTYNRFHDPCEHDLEIERLRELHADMDRAVLRAYGWDDIPTECEFLLDYEIDEEEWRNKKKPYRYRWHDEVRDEVLARLIALNAERAAEEQRSGAAAAAGRSAATRKRGRSVHAPAGQGVEAFF
jgi:hypothetical protein